MTEIKHLLKRQVLNLKGAIYKNSDFAEFHLGEPAGELELASSKVKVLVNRTLQSLMNPQAVARDVFGVVDLKSINPDILVEAAYSSDWNFIGRPIDGYKSNKCYLTSKAAKALSEVQKDVSKQGYSLLVFDCYRPQRAVNQFVSWTKDTSDSKMQSVFYPDEVKKDLIKRGYIDSKSGHSRASTVDLTLVRTGKFQSKDFNLKAKAVNDCRISQKVEDTGQVDMGTTFDCFSELAHTANLSIPEKSQKNRKILKSAMEKQGFANYPKEWWHFVLKDEPYKSDYFDFEVQ
jgi:D-alanyl-D-alanine dipeptidase